MSEQSFRILHRVKRWSGLYKVVGGELRVASAYGDGRMPLGRGAAGGGIAHLLRAREPYLAA